MNKKTKHTNPIPIENRSAIEGKTSQMMKYMRQKLYSTMRVNFGKLTVKTRCFGNRIPAFEWAKDWMKENQKIPLQTDKDGGFCLVDKQAAKTLIREKLKPEIYEVAEGIDCFHASKMLEKSGDKVAEAFDDKK